MQETEIINIQLDNFERFGQYKHIIIPNIGGNTMEKINCHIKLNPAPEGYRWKQNWPTNLIEKFRLRLGESTIIDIEKEWFQLSASVLETSMYHISDKFDYDDDERTIRSRQPIETSIEIFNEFKINLIAVSWHPLHIYIKLNSVENMLERIPSININTNTIMDDSLNLINLCNINYVGRYEPHTWSVNNDSIQHFYYHDTKTAIINHNNQRTTIDIVNNGVSPMACFWIRNEDDTEIPFQVVKHIRVLFNNTERYNLSGNEARFYMKNLMTDKIKENIASENIYFLSYSSGRRDNNSVVHGINFSRFDSYKIEIEWESDALSNVKFTLCHKTSNYFRTASGFGGVRYVPNSMYFRNGEGFSTIIRNFFPEQQYIAPINPVPSNKPKIVDHIVIKDETTCIISFEIITPDTMIEQCNQCKYVYLSKSIDDWMKMASSNYKCPYCSNPYTVDNFIKGKAKIE